MISTLGSIHYKSIRGFQGHIHYHIFVYDYAIIIQFCNIGSDRWPAVSVAAPSHETATASKIKRYWFHGFINSISLKKCPFSLFQRKESSSE